MCTAQPDQAIRHTCQLRIDKARFQRCAHALFNGEVLPSLAFLLRSRGLHRDEIALKRMATEIETQAFARWAWDEIQAFQHLLGRYIATRRLKVDP